MVIEVTEVIKDRREVIIRKGNIGGRLRRHGKDRKGRKNERIEGLGNFYSQWHVLDPMTSWPGSASPDHVAPQTQPRGLIEAGFPRLSPCSSVTKKTEDSLNLSWEEMMCATQIRPLQTQNFSILAWWSPWALAILLPTKSPVHTDGPLMSQNTGNRSATHATTPVFIQPNM